MSFVEEEIRSQPQVWREAAALGVSLRERLASPGSRVAFFGCGTSFYVAQAVAALRESAGPGESDAFAASEFPRGRRYDLAVALSRSGTTTEVLELVEAVAGSLRVLAVTADEGSPLAGLAAHVVAMPFADEKSVVQTRFATATLALFRASFGEDEAVAAAAGDAERALASSLPDVADVRQLVFLASGWRIGLAHEAALKVREAAQAWS